MTQTMTKPPVTPAYYAETINLTIFGDNQTRADAFAKLLQREKVASLTHAIQVLREKHADWTWGIQANELHGSPAGMAGYVALRVKLGGSISDIGPACIGLDQVGRACREGHYSQARHKLGDVLHVLQVLKNKLDAEVI